MNSIQSTFRCVSIFLFATTYLLTSLPLLAQVGNSAGQRGGAITTAVPFLLITPNSRSGGLGEAGVAIIDDANAMFMNPSALAFTNYKFGFSLNYTPWLRSIVPDINHAYVPAYYNFGDKGGVAGVALTFFSLGDIQFTDARGNDIGSFNANEFSLSASYTRKLTDILSAGVSLRYIYSNLVGTSLGTAPIEPGNSVAGDVNVFITKDFKFRKTTKMNFKWGINISNIGSKMNYTTTTAQKDFLPTNLKMGYALTAFLDEHNSITLTNDFNKLLVPTPIPRSLDENAEWRDKDVMTGIFTSFSDAPGGFSEEMTEITTSIGLEYWYSLNENQRLFAARLGYFYEDPLKGNRRFLNMGIGFKFKMLTLDFAYLVPISQNHPLQNTLRFSLGFEFGEKSGD